MPTPPQNDFYKVGGMQVDVNPFEQQDQDCNLLLNFYSHKYLAKKVRFGYTKFLDNPDGRPVRNLIFYQFPSSTGLLRVSGNKTYQTTTQTGSWGSSLSGLNWTSDVRLGTCQLSGAQNYVHLSDAVDGYKTWNGSAAASWTGGFTPKSSFLTAYQSRSFGDVNQLTLAESYIDFDLSLPPAASGDPFYFNSNSASPAQGGTTSVDSGNGGKILDLSVVQNCVLIYKQRAVYRYDGTNFLPLNFSNSIVPNSRTTSDNLKIDYFLSFNSIYSCDAQSVPPISFGINTIIQDTYTNLGIPTALSFCFDYLNFFYLGKIYYNGTTLSNAMFVRDERFNEWYIWTVGHNITAFGSYTDNNNVRHMVTGDDQGNTYVWGEQYSSDNGTAINYRLRTRYIDHGAPSGTKIPQPQLSVSASPSDEAQVSVAKNYTDQYKPIGTTSGYFSKLNLSGSVYPQYKTISLEIAGSTTTSRPEFYGWSVSFDEEERFSDSRTNRQARR